MSILSTTAEFWILCPLVIFILFQFLDSSHLLGKTLFRHLSVVINFVKVTYFIDIFMIIFLLRHFDIPVNLIVKF